MDIRHPFGWLSEPGQKWAFVVCAVVAVLVMTTLQVLGGPLKTPVAGGGIVSFELAGSLQTARSIVASWGRQGQVYAGLNLGLDYLFIVSYASAIGLGCVLVARALRQRARALSVLGIGLAWAQWLAALLDAMENYSLIQVLLGSDRALWPLVARWCALPKFLIVALALVFVVLGAVLSAAGRPPSQHG